MCKIIDLLLLPNSLSNTCTRGFYDDLVIVTYHLKLRRKNCETRELHNIVIFHLSRFIGVCFII